MAEGLSAAQRTLIRVTWAELVPESERVGELFYNRLFQTAPHVRGLFHGDMAAQQRQLLAMLATAVEAIDELDTVLPRFQELGRRHARYGVEAAHYEDFQEALVWTLQVVLGPNLTPEAEEAWNRLFEQLGAAMRNGATASPSPVLTGGPSG